MSFGSALTSALSRIFIAAAAVALTGCASFYVDGNTKEVPAAQFVKPAAPKPAQLFYEFQTKGVANGTATGATREQVVKLVQESGLFSAVGTEAAPSAASLSVTIDNVPLTSENDAFAKGFAAGFTLGLAGSTVTDGYVCTVKYTPAGGSEPLTVSARHAVHTGIGSGGPPPGAIKAANAEEAVRTMIRQLVSTALNDLSRQTKFSN